MSYAFVAHPSILSLNSGHLLKHLSQHSGPNRISFMGGWYASWNPSCTNAYLHLQTSLPSHRLAFVTLSILFKAFWKWGSYAFPWHRYISVALDWSSTTLTLVTIVRIISKVPTFHIMSIITEFIHHLFGSASASVHCRLVLPPKLPQELSSPGSDESRPSALWSWLQWRW